MRSGQLAALAAVILAIAILQSLAWSSPPSYRIARFCGPLESAELIAFARAAVAQLPPDYASWSALLREFLESRFSQLRSAGELYGHCTELYDIELDVNVQVETGSGRILVSVENLATRLTGVPIVYNASWNYALVGIYVKRVGDKYVVYLLYNLSYLNLYEAPQWGRVRYCPLLRSLESRSAAPPVSVAQISECRWLVSVPRGLREAYLVDEFGVKVVVLAGG